MAIKMGENAKKGQGKNGQKGTWGIIIELSPKKPPTLFNVVIPPAKGLTTSLQLSRVSDDILCSEIDYRTYKSIISLHLSMYLYNSSIILHIHSIYVVFLKMIEISCSLPTIFTHQLFRKCSCDFFFVI